MKRPFKILLWSVAAIGAFLVALAVVLIALFDPNQYKDTIAAVVQERTGRSLTIGGRIGWTFFPRLGLEASDLALGNARGFGGEEPFAHAETAGVRVRLWPLLRGELAVDTLYLHGLTLHLARNAAGRTNWEDLLAAAPEAKPSAAAPAGGALAALAFARLDVRRATITWHDLPSGTRLAVRELALETGRFTLGAPLGLKLGFVLEYGQPQRRLHTALTAQLLAQAGRLELNALNARLDQTHLQGRIALEDFATPRLHFELDLDRLDLDRLLPPPAPASPAGGGRQAPPTPAVLPLAALRTLALDGKLTVGHLKALGLQATDLVAALSAGGGRIRLGPQRARLYGGSHAGDIWLDVRTDTPVFQFHERLTQVQLGAFLRDAGLYDQFQGTADVEARLTARGRNTRQLKQTLDGTVTLQVRDGKIEGINLQKLITQARALYDQARGKPLRVVPAAGDETMFRELRATAQVTRGVVRNDDLVLAGPVLRATGSGTTDLVRETLDYRLEVTLAEGEGRAGTTVPVRIRGPFAQLQYTVDLGAVLQHRLERKLERQLEKLFQKP